MSDAPTAPQVALQSPTFDGSSGGALAVDATQLGTFLDCPEQYRLKYLERLRKIREAGDAQQMPFGIAVHAGLEQYYRQQPAQMESAFLSLYPTAFTPEEELYTPANGLILLRQYVQFVQQNDVAWKVLGVEIKDMFELAPGYPYLVKIDLLVETPFGICPVDHKTTAKYLNEDYWRPFEMSGQLTGYAAYCQQKYGQCSGVFINGLMVRYRQRAYKGELAGFHCAFQRQLFNRTQEQIDNWKLRTMRTIDRLRATQHSGLWEQNTSHCRYCEMSPLCQSVDNEGVRAVLYEHHDPYAYLGDSHVHH